MAQENEFWNAPDLEAITGSVLYGVSTPLSDIDLRGFVAEPPHLLLGLDKFEQKEFKDSDRVVYGMAKFFKILRQGNTNALEALFATTYTHLSDIGKMVLANRQVFVSKAYHRAIRGFALCEWRKARAVSLHMEYEDKEAEDIFTLLAGKYQLKRFEINEVMDLVFANRDGDPRKETSSTRHLGERRKGDVETFGFSTKNAYHAIRLLHEGIELMKTNEITFPRPNVDELKDIRNGKVSIDDLDIRFKDLDAQLDDAANKSTLPARAVWKDVNDLYIACVQMKLSEGSKHDSELQSV